jgi:hypothetical protein
MWFAFFAPGELCCYAKNLIQYQAKESQCSQYGEGSAHNLDKALVPVKYFRANYQRFKPSGIISPCRMAHKCLHFWRKESMKSGSIICKQI